MASIIPPLNKDADLDATRHWLREVVATIGPGFHVDTLPRDYVDSNGELLLSGPDEARLSDGLRRAATTLGQQVFEETALEEVWRGLGLRYDSDQDRLVRISS